jgi:CcmD family protein
MSNFESLFTAYIMVWVIFLVYEVTVARRVSRLQEEVERLKEQLRQG